MAMTCPSGRTRTVTCRVDGAHACSDVGYLWLMAHYCYSDAYLAGSRSTKHEEQDIDGDQSFSIPAVFALSSPTSPHIAICEQAESHSSQQARMRSSTDVSAKGPRDCYSVSQRFG